MDNSTGTVLVCSKTLAERRKLLGYFSRRGALVSLCSTPAFAIQSLDNDAALMVVNLFDCDWPAQRWADALATQANKVPVLFVHDARSIDAISAARDANADVDSAAHPQLHLTKQEFLSMEDASVSGIRSRILSAHTTR